MQWTVVVLWQVLTTLCYNTDTSWDFPELWLCKIPKGNCFIAHNVCDISNTSKIFFCSYLPSCFRYRSKKMIRPLELKVLHGTTTRFLIALLLFNLRQKEWFFISYVAGKSQTLTIHFQLVATNLSIPLSMQQHGMPVSLNIQSVRINVYIYMGRIIARQYF